MLEIVWNPGPRQLRHFALLLAMCVLAGAAWLGWRGAPTPGTAGLLVLAPLLGTLGLLRPTWLRPIYVAWMALAFPIGWLVSHLLMAGIYYLILTPIGLALHLAGYDPLRRRRDPAAPSYWIPRRPRADRERYFKQY